MQSNAGSEWAGPAHKEGLKADPRRGRLKDLDSATSSKPEGWKDHAEMYLNSVVLFVV